MAFLHKSLQLSLRKPSLINIHRPCTNLCMTLKNPFPGLDIGIPLTIFQNTYTTLHYGENIITLKLIALQFLLGYYAYGTDRYNDAIEYHMTPYNTTKKVLYEDIYENQILVYKSLMFSYLSILTILLYDENFVYNIPFVFILQTLNTYKKTKPKLGVCKPLYISIMWTLCAVIIPCVLHDHDYSIFNYPEDYLPCTLTLFAASNIIDNKDIEEDTKNGINTIPVFYGKDNSNYISIMALICSSVLLGTNPHYLDNVLGNSYLEIQNAAISYLPFVINGTKII